MTHWTPEILDEIRRRADLAEIAGRYVALRPQGQNLMGRCPFHEDRSPSFSVSSSKQLFYCFGCQAGGDVFDFIMKKEGLDFAGAVEMLARETGVELLERRLSPAEVRQRQLREDVLRVLAEAASLFRQVLERWEGAEKARRYLDERGVSEETRERFGLGYAPGGDRIVRTLLKRGFPRQVISDAGLAGSDGGRDRFRERVMFPIRDDQGRVVAFGGRILADGHPKYLNSPETPVFNKRLIWFALDLARPAIREHRQALVMEGYMDVITAHQHGFTNAVASLGTALSQEQAWALARHAQEVVMAYDADAAGATATMRGIELFRRAGCTVRVARVPDGKDPDGFLRSRGAEAFRVLIADSQPLVDFVFDEAAAAGDLSTVEGKVAVVEAILPHILAEESAVAREAHIRRLAPRLGVSEESLRQDLKRRGRAGGRHLAPKGEEYRNRNTWQYNMDSHPGRGVSAGGLAGFPQGGVERHLLRLMLLEPEFSRRAREAVRPEDFEVDIHRRLAQSIYAAEPWVAPPGEGAALPPFSAEDPTLRELAAALLMEEEREGEDPERAFIDCLKGMERRQWEKRIAALNREIEESITAGKSVAPEKRAELQELQRLASRERPVSRCQGNQDLNGERSKGGEAP